MKKLAILLFATLLAINVYSAFLRNVQVELKQPDGAVILCFITGDEFHRRVHDKDNYTIVQNPTTGYYVYAIRSGDKLIPSEYVVGKSDPKQISIEPNLDIPASQMEEKSSEMLRTSDMLMSGDLLMSTEMLRPKNLLKSASILKSAKMVAENPTKGDFNNIVISIRFSEQEPITLKLQEYDDKFNSTTQVSLKSYYKEVSSSQLHVTSNFYPQPQNQTILEFQDTHPRAYYLEYNEITNPIGYKVGEEIDREQNLIKSAIDNVKNQIITSQINFDLNNDGFIDNLIFIIQGNPDVWGKILWPKSMSVNGFQIYLGNKQVNQYNIQLSSILNVGTICHEFFHALGAPDLYHYTNIDSDPVGSWDIMGGSATMHMTTFMKWKYGKWFENIPEITQTGTYTLKPLSTSPDACYKILSPNSPNEYFVVEYRKKEGLLESSIPSNYDDGLIIYRINTQVPWGNAYGPPDEFYIYRPNCDVKRNGDINHASFSSNSSRTVFNTESNPSCFLSNGESGWIDISNVSNAGSEISFTVNLVQPLPKPRNFTASLLNNQVLLKWNSPIKTGQTLLGYNVFIARTNSPLNTTLITDTTFQTTIPGQNSLNSYWIKAKYQLGNSEPAICNFINSEIPSIKDSLALVALYNQCGGPNWTKKNNWLTGPLNTWQGVIVENGRVVELSLEYAGLSGPLYEGLSVLNKIRLLDLTSNNLTGTLPEGWSALVSLRYLILSINKLTGSLPQSWSDLVNIDFLRLNRNQLSGSLPESWSALVNMRELLLADNQLSGSLPESWSALVSLEDLWLNNNNLSGTLPNSWSTFVNLKQMVLNLNKLSGTLPESWSAMTKLEALWLADNHLTGAIPDNWKVLTNLREVQLNFNQLSGTLPESWSALTKLERLWLSGNQFTGTLPASWSALVNLNWLLLNGNRISGLPVLSAWTKLNNLNVQGNQLDFGDIEPNIGIPKIEFLYTPQAPVGLADTILKNSGEEFRIAVTVGGNNNKYQWYKNGVSISGATGTEFVIPSIVLENSGNYTCQITNSVAINLTLQSQPISLQIANHAPFANAGTDQSVNEGAIVTLDGSLSSDPDGNLLTYKWTAPAGINLILTNEARPTFTAPEVTTNTNFTFSLVVNDGTVDSPIDQVVITVKNVNKLPVANAGVDRSVNEGTSVILDGSASSDADGNPLSYKWTAPAGISLSSTTAAKPSFTSPEVSANTNYTFSLVVNDGTVDSPVDQVVITVKNVNKAPVANAGIDQLVNEASTVSLDGSASSDPDESTITYKWTAPAGITLSSTTTAKPTFTAPEVTINTNYTFSLVVNDGTVDSPVDQVVITVKNVNKAPVANAGVDQFVNEGTSVSLDGSASTDPDGNLLTYKWTVPAEITLSSTTVAKPTFTAPEVTTNTNYTFSLVVNDGTVDSPVDQVIIAVKNVNKAPIANAGSDQSVNEGTTVSLEGSASSDPDGYPLTYKWTAPAGITLSSATTAKPTFTAPEVTANTNYTFSLVVNDGTVDSPVDQVVITVKNVNKPPVANAGTDQSVNEGASVSLDGSASSDPDGISLTYKWIAPAGIALSSTTASKPTFTAPEVTTNTNYSFSLVVNDGTVDSPVDQVVVAVKNVNKVPVANAGSDQTVNEGTTVSLDGSASSDPDGNPITYNWSAPIGIILSSTTVAKPIFTAPEVKKDSTLNFSLVVNDGLVSSSPATVKVTVLNVIKVGITTIESPLLKIYPNPTKGIIQVEFGDIPQSGTWIRVYDISGKTVCKIAAKNKIETLNLNNHPAGLYLVRIDQKLPKTYKIVLEKTESVH